MTLPTVEGVGKVARSIDNSSIIPLFADQNLVHTCRMHAERHKSKIPGRKLGSNARPVRFVSSWVRIGRENDEVDSQLRAGELNDLLKEPTVNQLARRWGGIDIEPDAQCDETVATVGNPERLDSGVVVDVTEHVGIFLVPLTNLKVEKTFLVMTERSWSIVPFLPR
jgi:hypothetical protein